MNPPPPNERPRPRIAGRKVALGLVSAIGLVVATAITVWWNTREPDGPIGSIAAVSDDAVIIVRRGFSQRDYVHIVSRDLRQHAQRWSIALFSTQPGARPSIADGRVALRVRDARGRPEIHAFDIAEGRFAFRAAAVDPVPDARLTSDEAVLGHRLALAYGAPIARLFSIDARSGRVEGERSLPQGTHAVRVALTAAAIFVEQPDGHVARTSFDAATTDDLGAGSLCVIADRAFVFDGAQTLRVFGAARAPEATYALGDDLGEQPRIAACAGDSGRALLVVTSGHGAPRTTLLTVTEGAVVRGETIPQRVEPRFGGARGLPSAPAYALPFVGGYVRVLDATFALRATYRVTNARAPLVVRAFDGVSVLVLADRLVLFRGATPIALRFTPHDGSGVVADVDVLGERLFVAVEREVVALDLGSLAPRAQTDDVDVEREDVRALLSRVAVP